MRKPQLWLVILALCVSQPLLSQDVEGILTPGGFALVPVFSPDRPRMRFGLRPIAVMDDQSESGVWLGLVGIDLLTAPGHYLLTKGKQGDEAKDSLIDIAVQPIEHSLRPSSTITSWIEEYLRNAPAEDAEDHTVEDMVGDWQQTQFFSFPFFMPLEEGKLDETTIGTYVRYPSGRLEPVDTLLLRTDKARTPVFAPSGGMIHKIEQSDGRLVNTSMAIDHGQGVFSILKGEIYPEVVVGDIVAAGEAIALFTAGDRRIDEGTRELSWQLVLNGDLVNPAHFLGLDLSAYFQKLTADAQAYFAAKKLADEAAEQAAREVEAADQSTIQSTTAPE